MDFRRMNWYITKCENWLKWILEELLSTLPRIIIEWVEKYKLFLVRKKNMEKSIVIIQLEAGRKISKFILTKKNVKARFVLGNIIMIVP